MNMKINSCIYRLQWKQCGGPDYSNRYKCPSATLAWWENGHLLLGEISSDNPGHWALVTRKYLLVYIMSVADWPSAWHFQFLYYPLFHQQPPSPKPLPLPLSPPPQPTPSRTPLNHTYYFIMKFILYLCLYIFLGGKKCHLIII